MLITTYLNRNLESILKALIASCRDYFPEGATVEMLEEWRPLLGPKNTHNVMAYFEMFLPTFNCFERAESTYDVWFKELMQFWTASHNPPWSTVRATPFRLLSKGLKQVFWQFF